MGVGYAPQTQLYSSGTDMTSPSSQGAAQQGVGWPTSSTWHVGNQGMGSNTELNFSAPGGGLSQGPSTYPGQSGKTWGGGNPNVNNQVPGGTPGPNAPNFDPALGMNAVYAPFNQLPGTSASPGAPDFGMSTTQPVALANGQPNPQDLFGQVTSNPNTAVASGFGISPYFLGNYSYLAGQDSPFGISPYWNSPFVSAAQNGGKGIA